MSDMDEIDDDKQHSTGPVGVPIETQLAIHSMQLSNGVKVFAELREEIGEVKAHFREEVGEIKAKMMPKPINWTTIVLGGISVLVTILGAWWALSEKFAARPTREEIKSAVGDQQKSLEQQSNELRTVRDQQTEQRVILNTLREEVKDTGKKIDLLLQDSPNTLRRASQSR
jgi:hypothetical protein